MVVGTGKDPARQALALTNQAEQQVLGLDLRAAKLRGLVPGEEQDPAGALRVAFEHFPSQIIRHATAPAFADRNSRRSLREAGQPAFGPMTGKYSWKVVPRPGSLSTSTVPPI